MSLALQTTGLATHLQFCFVVDQDGATVREFVSSVVNGDMTVNGNVTFGSATWKGVSRGYFETKKNGSFDFFGITFGTNKPPFDLSTAQRAYFVATAGAGAGGGFIDPLLYGTSGFNVLGRNSSNKAVWNVNSTEFAGSTTLPTDTTTKFSFGANFLTTAKADFYYGLESGSLAADGTNNPGARGSGPDLIALGGFAATGSFPAKLHIVAGFNTNLSLAEFQSLHDDWFGTLFQTLTLTGTAATGGQTGPGNARTIPL